MADPLIQAGNNAASNVAPDLSANANIPAGQAGSPWSLPMPSTQNSTVPTVMTPTQAFNNNPIPVPTVTSPDSSPGLVAGAMATSNTLQGNIDALTPEPTDLDRQNQGLLDSISQLTGQDTGKAQAQIDAEAASGATADKKALQDINNQIISANAAYEKQFANIGLQNGVTLDLVTGQQGALRRAQAADIGLLTARAQVMQGNLTLALETANRAVDAKYSTIEDQIKTKQAQLDALQPQLTKQQKIQALAQQKMLDDQTQALADKKQQEKDVTNLMLQYSKADIKSTDTLVSAAQKASAYLAKQPDDTQAAGKLQVIGSHYDDMGNKVDSYGFVNEKTGIVTPYNASPAPGDTSPGNTNFGLTTGNMFGLPTYNTQANNPGINRPIRNNNPGNIKASAATVKYPGVVGIESTPAADGGNFLIFANAQAGIASIGQLLQNGSSYKGVTAEQAIKKYNGGGGYGAKDLGLDPNKDFQSQIKDPAVLQNVASAIAKHEGFSTSSSNDNKAASGVTGSSQIDATQSGYTDKIVGNTGLSQSAIDQAALQYAMTNKMPSLGLSGKGQMAAAKQAILNRAGELNKGGNISANQAQLKALSSTLTQQTEYANTVDRSLTNAENGFKQIISAFSNVGINPSESKFANTKVNNVNNFFGKNTEALRSFQAGLYEVQNEYAQVFSRGGTRTLEGNKEAQDLLSGNLSIKDLISIQKELQQQGDIVKNGSRAQVQQVQDQINNIISPGSKTSSGTTTMTGPDGKQWTVPNDKVNLFKQNGYK